MRCDGVIRVLYIVDKGGSTSIPLEVANIMSRHKLDLSVATFKVNSDRIFSDIDCKVIQLGARSICDPVGVRNLYKCIDETQPDVVHVHHTASAFWGALLAKPVAGAAVIRTEHNNQRHYTVAQNILHGCAQALADRILCNSKDTYENLYPLQKCFVGDDWEVVYNGVNIDRIEDASSRPSPFSEEVPSNRTVIGSVGRLVDQKNYSRLIQAFLLVAREISGLHLMVIGDGENRRELERKARSEGIDDRITFTGELPRDDVYAALHQFDLFVMPSLWEGFCNAVVEAMAAGNPIVSSDISTLREVIGDVARYVDPKKPSDIANGLIEVIQEDQEKRRQRKREGRRRAVENYSIERTAEAYIRNYFKAIGQTAPVGKESKIMRREA